MAKTLVEEIKEEVLGLLADRPMTSHEIAEEVKCNYYTVRRAMTELEAEDRIIKFDRKVRGARWTLGTNNGPNSVVPYLKMSGKDYKYTELTEAYITKLPKVFYDKALSVFATWVTIAQTAERLHGGMPDEVLTKRLNAKKADLINARTNFENMAFVCTQMLDQPKLWDPNYLTQFPDDKDWPEFRTHLESMINIIKEGSENGS